MKVYLELCGCDAVSLGRIGIDESLDQFQQQDWGSELKVYQRRMTEGRYGCSPGMEWLSDDGSTLTVIAGEDGLSVIYQSQKKFRILGVIPTPARATTAVSAVPEVALRGILAGHYGSDQRLEKMIRKAGKRMQWFD